jgi:hypothetical protein
MKDNKNFIEVKSKPVRLSFKLLDKCEEISDGLKMEGARDVINYAVNLLYRDYLRGDEEPILRTKEDVIAHAKRTNKY